jgi:hypothetical protein
MNSVSKQLRERFRNQGQNPQSPEASEAAAEMLGFVSRMAVEAILADISKMLASAKMRELDGYIFALSRIMKHDLAWDCIKKSFEEKKMTIPAKYFEQFGQKPEQQQLKNRMEVQ